MPHFPEPDTAGDHHAGSSFVEFKREEIEQSIADRFEQQVRTHPDRLAIKAGQSILTYEKLNRAANGIAHTILARAGVGNEPVALLAENYAMSVVATFGILKAGKTCVPLDSSLPVSRIRHVLKDAGVRLIVAARKSAARARKLKAEKLNIVDMGELHSEMPDNNPGLAVRPDAVAWILYTSSSTGEPKGVPQTHRSELHNIMNMTNSQRLCSDDRMTLLRSPILGGAIRNTLSALLNGASLFPFDIKTEGFKGLAEWLVRERITLFHSAATVFRNFVQTLGGHERFSTVRLIRLGSEPVSWKDVELARKHFAPQCVLVNALSSTEATTFLQYFVSWNTPNTGGNLPVGFPVQDFEISLMDQQGRQVERGEIGEIIIRSRYLFPGYWRNPELTRVVLLPDPDGGDQAIFRTGDLGRMLPDGSYEYCGRRDFQHKVRGYRVHTDEVEAALRTLPDIAHAAVVAQDAPLKKRLVAYVVPRNGRPFNIGRVRNALKKNLPEFMIPSIFQPVKSLPLTPGGKVDRRALPAASKSRPKLACPVAEPRTRLEKEIARIWRETLHVAAIGIHDNFFALGGDSLSAAQITAKIRDAFQLELRLRAIFNAPTIAGLAARIQKALERRRAPTAPPIAQTAVGTRFPLSYAQTQVWLVNQMLPGTSLFNICDAQRIKGVLDAGYMRASMSVLVQRHEALRSRFLEVEKEPVQIIGDVVNLEMPVVELRQIPATERDAETFRLATDEANRFFDLAAGPLIRAKLFRLAEDDHLLLITMHHIIADQWSMQLFRHELALIYGAISRGLAPSLPELPIRFADFVAWERQAMNSDFMKRQLAYWERELAGALPRLAFKRRGRKQKRMSFRTSRLPLRVDEKLFADIRASSRQEGSTPFMVLLAALNVTIHLHTGERDIRIGTLVANRSWAGTERIIGHFINTVILRQRLSGTLTLREILAQARESTLAAQAHQNLPFEALVRVLETRRKIDRTSLFQVMFIYHNSIFHPADPPGLTFSRPDPAWERADAGVTLTTCDLVFFLRETKEGLTGSVIFKSDVVDSAAASAICQTFTRVLNMIIGSPEMRVANLAVGKAQRAKR